MFLEDPPFPSCPSLDYTSEPMYSVTAIKTAGGHEGRNRNWDRPLHRYSCSVGPQEEEVSELLEFWHALGGSFIGFRFKDWVDFKSCRFEEEPTALDQPIVDLENSSGDLQLVKQYVFGDLAQDREITKPVLGTILIADNGVQLTEGADWTLDYTTGIVTLTGPPAGALTWGGEFDVPCRFASEFPVNMQNRMTHIVSFMIEELRPTEDEIVS